MLAVKSVRSVEEGRKLMFMIAGVVYNVFSRQKTNVISFIRDENVSGRKKTHDKEQNDTV